MTYEITSMRVLEAEVVVEKPVQEKVSCITRLEEATKVAGNVIYNVPVCGLKSLNGYDYAEDGLKAAVHMYEGLDVYLNHTKGKAGEARPVQEKIGFLKGAAYRDGKGIYAAELHVNEAHPSAAQILWWAENDPSRIGLSHDADIRYNKTTRIAEGIERVFSADIVSKAATTKAIREGLISDQMKNNQAKVYLDTLISTAYDLARGVLWSGDEDEVRRTNLLKIFKDLVKELNKEEPAMEWEKLNLEELRKHRADLVHAIEADVSARVLANEKRVTEALNKVPEKARTKVFESQIRAAADQKFVDELVADRLAVVVPAQEGVLAPKKLEVEVPAKDLETEVLSSLGIGK